VTVAFRALLVTVFAHTTPCAQFLETLAAFQNSFTAEKCMKFPTKSLQYFSPRVNVYRDAGGRRLCQRAVVTSGLVNSTVIDWS